MSKRFHTCAFVLGASLVLLALLLAVSLQRAPHPARAHQTLRVAQAVTHLQEGCLTCHQVQTLPAIRIAPALTHAYIEQVDLHTISLAVTPIDLQARVKTRLIDLGQRLLALPADRTGRQDRVTASFLKTVDAVQSAGNADPVQMQSLLWPIDDLEALLQALESQASPYHWDRQDSRPIQACVVLADSQRVSSPAALLVQRTRLIAAVSEPARVQSDPRLYVRPLEIVFASQRHGPPAGLFLDSGWSGRLLTVV